MSGSGWARSLNRALGAAAGALFLAACGTLGYHEVKKGETLYSISWRYGADYRELARWNGIQPPYIIHEGQRLRLTPPGGRSSGEAGKPVARQAAPRPRQQPGNAQPPAAAASAAASPRTASRPPQPRPEEEIPNRKLSWAWPARGKVIRTFSAGETGKQGIDIEGRAGSPVRAAAFGRVVYSGSGLRHYGNLIIIKHNARYLSAYAHNRKLLVAEGAVVEKGQKIAEMGRSGTGADRVMLHFEIRADGKPVDPLSFLPAGKS